MRSKKILLTLYLFSAFTLLTLCGAEKISVKQGASETVRLSFEAARFSGYDKNVANVSQLNPQQFAIQGLKPGTTSVTFIGAEGQDSVFEISVLPNIDEVFTAVRRMLDDVPEVDIFRVGERVGIKGGIANLNRWNQVKTVVVAFGANIIDLTNLEIPPELIVGLKEAFEMSGLKVAEQGEGIGNDNPGVYEIVSAGHTIYIRGTAFSQNEISRIRDLVSSQNQLKLEVESGDDKDKAVDNRFLVAVNVGVAPLTVEVDVAFIALTEEDHKQVGVNLFEAGLMTVDVAGALVGDVVRIASKDSGRVTTDGTRVARPTVSTRDRTSGNTGSLTYSVVSQMAGVLHFYTENNPSRLIHRAQLNFRNGSDEWREIHSGGTIKVPLVGREVASMEDIDYGFIMKTRGTLIDGNNATIDVNFELSTPEALGTGHYDVKRERVITAVDCGLGHTMVLSGLNSLLDSASEQATPFLSKIPLLKHFFSQKYKGQRNTRILVLVSPHIVQDVAGAVPHSAVNVQTLQDAEVPSANRLER